MPTLEQWWRAWAPFWEFLEDRHLSTYTTKKIEGHIQSPVLVVGAGQGLIVDLLRKRGHTVDGVDLEATMIEWAKRRRGLHLIRANAKNLPFASESYKTVIVASGVVDYLRDEEEIGNILAETGRVLKKSGKLLVAFHQLEPKIERIYKNIGVIGEDTFFMRRIFNISEAVKSGPFPCVKLVSGWTGRNYLRTFAYWTKLGLTLPKELKDENKRIDKIYEHAAKHRIPKELLFKSVPAEIPYRREHQVSRVLGRLGIQNFNVVRTKDCLVTVLGKTAFPMPRPHGSKSLEPLADSYEPNQPFMIETRNLTKKYKGSSIPAVDGLSLRIETASVFGILGPNGAGKTTTLMMLSGLIKPDSGTIHFPHAHEKNKRKKNLIGYVPQELALYPRLSGKDNLVFFGRLYNLSGHVLEQRIEELLEIIGLADRADDLVSTYSTGMKRRLNLAVGMIHKPRIVLMDEPTVGIDPQSRNRIYDTIARLRRDGATILYTTHYMDEASRICDRIAIIDRGSILLSGAPDDIVKQHGSCLIEYEASHPSDELVSSILKMEDVDRAVFEGKTLVVTARNRNGKIKQLDAIEEIATRQKTQLTLKNVTEPNLESLFLDLTGRKLRDKIDDAF